MFSFKTTSNAATSQEMFKEFFTEVGKRGIREIDYAGAKVGDPYKLDRVTSSVREGLRQKLSTVTDQSTQKVFATILKKLNSDTFIIPTKKVIDDDGIDLLITIPKAFSAILDKKNAAHYGHLSLTKWLAHHLDNLLKPESAGLIDNIFKADVLRILITSCMKGADRELYLEKVAAAFFRAPVGEVQTIYKQINEFISDLEKPEYTDFEQNHFTVNNAIKIWCKNKQNESSKPNDPERILLSYFNEKLNPSTPPIAQDIAGEYPVTQAGILPLPDNVYRNKEKLLTSLSLYLVKAVTEYKYPILEYVDQAVDQVVEHSTDSQDDKETNFLARSSNPLEQIQINQELIDQKKHEHIVEKSVDKEISEDINQHAHLQNYMDLKLYNKEIQKLASLHVKFNNPSETDFGEFYTYQKNQVSNTWLPIFTFLEAKQTINFISHDQKKYCASTVEKLHSLGEEYSQLIKNINALPVGLQPLLLSLLPLKEVEKLTINPHEFINQDPTAQFLPKIEEALEKNKQMYEIFQNAANTKNSPEERSLIKKTLLSPACLAEFISKQRQYMADHAGSAAKAEKNIEKLLTLMVSTFNLKASSATLIYKAIFDNIDKNPFYKSAQTPETEALKLKYAAYIHASMMDPPVPVTTESRNLGRRASSFLKSPSVTTLWNSLPRVSSTDFIKNFRLASSMLKVF